MAKEIKRLYRSKKERIIAGVCGGIGIYFGIDPTLVRLLYIMTTVITGVLPGIIVYIIAVIIIPEER